MALRFLRRGNEKGRLHIGYRRRDWHDVWYEPVDGMSEPPDIGLYTIHHGGNRIDDPMEGEIAWHPWFDPKICESGSRPEQRLMQKRFLANAYIYCSERDAENILKLELNLHEPHFRRWTAFFEIAKAWKKKDMKSRQRRRATRTTTAEAAGLQQEEAEINSDSSDDEDDDGYVSEEDETARSSPKRKSEPSESSSPKKHRPDDGPNGKGNSAEQYLGQTA